MVTKDIGEAQHGVTGRRIKTLGHIGSGTVWRHRQVLSYEDTLAFTSHTAARGETPLMSDAEALNL